VFFLQFMCWTNPQEYLGMSKQNMNFEIVTGHLKILQLNKIRQSNMAT
jgi:hypothetical protein